MIQNDHTTGGPSIGRLCLVSLHTCEPRYDKTNNVVSEQARHKPSCTSTADGLRLEILDFEIGTVISVEQKQRR